MAAPHMRVVSTLYFSFMHLFQKNHPKCAYAPARVATEGTAGGTPPPARNL